MSWKDNFILIPVKYIVRSQRGRRSVKTELKESKNYLKRAWGELKNPIILPMHIKGELKLGVEETYYNFNPTIINFKSKLKIFSRLSNVSFSSIGSRSGKFKPRGKDRPLENQINSYRYSGGVLFREEEVIPLREVPNFEDPRAFIWRNEVWLIVNKVEKMSGKTNKNWKTGISILNSKTKEEILLRSPWDKDIEKNWSIIPCEDNIKVIYQTNPMVVIDYNNSGEIKKITEQINQYQDVNGGAPLVPIENGYYLRITRKKYRISRKQIVRVQYLSLINQKYIEIERSKPFIMNQLGNEIVNGMTLFDGMVYFTWSYDDQTNYLGNMYLDEVLTFIKQNVEIK